MPDFPFSPVAVLSNALFSVNYLSTVSCLPCNKHFWAEFWVGDAKMKDVGLPWGLSGKESACQRQETWVRSLVQKDPTCHRATKLVCHNYWACATEPTQWNYWSLVPGSPCQAMREAAATRNLLSAAIEQSLLTESRESLHSNEDPGQPKINQFFFLKKDTI